jgi:hypothetical protein
MHRAAIIGALLSILAVTPRSSAEPVLEPLGLYSARAVVSGTGEANRLTGLAACLVDVLVKVSGDPTIRDDPRTANLLEDAGRNVLHFRYQDRLEGRPVHDDQGTYDRPHYLTVHFDPAAIDRDLASLGRKPWPAPRPEVGVELTVTGRRRSFQLVSDDNIDESADMRVALAAAGETAGLVVSVPAKASAAVGGSIPARAKEQDRIVLTGDLLWSEEALGWVVQWSLPWDGRDQRWGASGVSFDTAFRLGLQGAAQLLSGHGLPH